MSKIQIDPEFQSCIPPLSGDERAALERNLVADGCRDSLVLWGNILIDGHNRYEICTRLSIPFRTVKRDFDSRESALLWIVEHQLGRRNLTDFARTEIALKRKSILESVARARQLESLKKGDSPVRLKSDERETGRTDVAVASAAGVGKDTVRNVEKVIETAVPEVIEAARSGAVSINAAAAVVTLPPEQQQAAAAEGPAGIKAAAKKAKAAKQSAKKKPAKKKPDAKPAANEPDEAAQQMIASLTARVEELQSLLAEQVAQAEAMNTELMALHAAMEASDELAEAGRQIAKLAAENVVLRDRLSGSKTTENEAKRAATSWKSKYERLAKEVGRGSPV